MNIFQAVILGILQGLAEFLPISSSGHLVLGQRLFGIEEGFMTFNILVHIGTLIPILIIFRKDVLAMLRRPFQKMTFLLIVATIPTIIVALLFNDFINNLFEGGVLLGVGFLITGTFLLYADSVKNGYKKTRDITYKDALVIGCFQAFAIAPAVSRSGSTITAALGCRLSRQTAAKFSFLMFIIAILGGAALEARELLQSPENIHAIGIAPMAVGFVSSMLTGFLAISWLLDIVRRGKLRYFSVYVYILGTLIIFDSLVTNFVF